VTAWGYAAGTGLSAIDAFFADPVVVPDDERRHFAEAVVDLPSALCFEPPHDLPAVPPLPARENGYVTLGSFHRLARLTPDVLDLWARVVAAVPGSHMLLKCSGLDDAMARERIVATFARRGVAAERLTILGATSRQDHLAAYARVDVQLDTFPQSGGVTTLEGLTMGVPSVTLLGSGVTGRISASFLTSLGLSDLIAETPDEYVATAVRVASDLDRLAHERATLRGRLLASPVGDARAYTRAVEAAYRTLWRDWCTRLPPYPARARRSASATSCYRARLTW
jgi:predicted O-linked N-acetylglucosamine transferase (SPINDLY family)